MKTIKESRVWLKLNKYLRLHKPHGYWMLQRIETGSTVRGFPDLLFLEGGTAIFIELKEVKGKQVNLSWEQVNMLTTLADCGFRAWVLAHKLVGKEDVYYLGHGRYAEDIKENGLDSPHMHAFVDNHKMVLYDMFTTMGVTNPIQDIS